MKELFTREEVIKILESLLYDETPPGNTLTTKGFDFNKRIREEIEKL
jgi:hypothetical protein